MSASTTRRLRVAMAGAGFFSSRHLAGWRACEAAELVALCDLDLVRAQAAARRFGIDRVHADAATMLDAERPDLLDIVTPPESHRDLVRLAAERGIAIVCQKPLAADHAGACDLVETAERAGVALIVHENFRFLPWFREAATLLDAGRLGAPHSVAFRLRSGDGQGEDAYLARQPYFRAMPRFLIHETGVHFVDVFRRLMGPVAAVSARLRRVNPAIAGEDAGYVVFEFASGATGLLDASRVNEHAAADSRLTLGELWLEGAAGVLRLAGDARLWWKPHGGDEVEHRYAVAADPRDAAVAALQAHVARHLLLGAPVENRGRDYLANLRVVEAIYRAHAEGRRIALEPPA